MNHYVFSLSGQQLWAQADGSIFWPETSTLVVSDLHLGKSERFARKHGMLLPPFETADTLERLQSQIQRHKPKTVVCLGDSFDDDDAARNIDEADRLWITKLQAGREWIWVAGNHDPMSVPFGGTQVGEFHHGPFVFRHIAEPDAENEFSGHFHPKARLSTGHGRVVRPCFLADGNRVIMPAFGTYTGGLNCTDPALVALMAKDAVAIMIGQQTIAMPMQRAK